VDGGELYVEEHGTGQPVLLIQGLGYAMWAWQMQVPALSRERRAIVFDNRGAGRSVKAPGPYTIELLADDAAAVLEDVTHGVPAHVVGLSMGGYIALTLALRHPELVRSLVLTGTAAGGPGTSPVPAATLDAWLAAAGLPPEEYARRTMPISFAPGWTDEHRAEYDGLLAARLEYPTPPECWAAQYDACTVFLERGAPVEQIDVPALVLHGDADRVVPVENGRSLVRRLPHSRLVVLAGRGHLAPLETPEAFNAEVLRFLDDVEEAPAVRRARRRGRSRPARP
jgi:pimeloyl-ACP methyl ester carboxylesterase